MLLKTSFIIVLTCVVALALGSEVKQCPGNLKMSQSQNGNIIKLCCRW